MNDSAKISCFVIGLIGDRLSEYGTVQRQVYEDSIQVWEKIILPACVELNIKPLRADHISRSGEIVEQICRHLRVDELVIADLTGGNPNVLYELGLRHTVNKLTLQIGEKGRLPFDISAIRTIQFSRSEAGFIDARNSLLKAIKVGLSQGADSVTANRVWNELSHDVLSEEETIQVSNTLDDDNDEPGFLEKLADSEAGFELMRSILESMTVTINEIGNIAKTATEETRRIDSKGSSAGAKLAVANRAAKKFQDKGSTLEAQVQEFEVCIRSIEPGISYILGRFESDPKLLKDAQAFIQSIRQLAIVTDQNEPITQKFIESMKLVGTASRSMRKATEYINKSVCNYIKNASVFKVFRDRLDKIEGGT